MDWDPNLQRIAELIVGKRADDPLMRLFASESEAITWVSVDTRERQLWRVHVVAREELEYVPPAEGTLVPKEGTTQ